MSDYCVSNFFHVGLQSGTGKMAEIVTEEGKLSLFMDRLVGSDFLETNKYHGLFIFMTARF